MKALLILVPVLGFSLGALAESWTYDCGSGDMIRKIVDIKSEGTGTPEVSGIYSIYFRDPTQPHKQEWKATTNVLKGVRTMNGDLVQGRNIPVMEFEVDGKNYMKFFIGYTTTLGQSVPARESVMKLSRNVRMHVTDIQCVLQKYSK